MPMGKDQKGVTLRMKKEDYAVVERMAKDSGRSLNKILSGIVLKTIRKRQPKPCIQKEQQKGKESNTDCKDKVFRITLKGVK